jgi:drug/metabolite transporter (DMT)-like permease
VNRQNHAYFYAICTVLLWSTVASAFKISLRYLDVWQLLLVSSCTATIFLLTTLIVQKKQSLLRELGKNDLLQLLGFGILNPFIYYLILLKAYSLLPAQVAQALNYTWAITLMLLSIPVLNHRVSKFDLLATLICYGGVIIICFGGYQFPSGALSYLGIALALGSTLIWALYWLYKTKDKLDPVVSLFVSFACSLPFIFVSCLIFSDLKITSTPGVLGGMYVGLFEMGITYILWLLAMQNSESIAKISTLIFLSPILSLFLIHYIVGERIAATTVIGLILIISGLLVQRKKEPLSSH